MTKCTLQCHVVSSALCTCITALHALQQDKACFVTSPCCPNPNHASSADTHGKEVYNGISKSSHHSTNRSKIAINNMVITGLIQELILLHFHFLGRAAQVLIGCPTTAEKVRKKERKSNPLSLLSMCHWLQFRSKHQLDLNCQFDSNRSFG